jgi:hypothetical protein
MNDIARLLTRIAGALAIAGLFDLPAGAQTPIYQWNFNGSNLNSTTGAGGVAAPVGSVAVAFTGGVNGGQFTQAAGSSDPAGTNFVPQLTGFGGGPDGLRFGSMNTTGSDNLLFSFDLAAVDKGNPATSGSRFYQVRYTTDGSSFTNLGGPLEFQRKSGSSDLDIWANQTTVSLAGVAAATNLRIDVVAIPDPATGSFAPSVAGTTYSAAAPVALDMATLFQGNIYQGAGSGDFQTSSWSAGAPVSDTQTSHVVFSGANTATVTNNNSSLRLRSISFTGTGQKTIDGQSIALGRNDSSQGTVMGGQTTLLNASGTIQTITAPIVLDVSQTWDTGSGGSLNITTGGVVINSTHVPYPTNLTIAGAGSMLLSAPILNLGATTITKTGPGTLTIPTDNSLTTTGSAQFVVTGGGLQVTNTGGGSATGAAAISVKGGTLLGNGRVAPTGTNTVTVASGGTIRGGIATAATAADKTLTIGSNGLTVQSGGVIGLNIYGNGTSTTGDGNVIAVTGAASVTNAKINVNLLNGTTAAGLRAAVGFPNTAVFTVVTSNAASTYSIDIAGSNFVALGFGPSEWSAFPVGNNLQLRFTPVPEPSLVILPAGLLVLAATRAYKRRSRSRESSPPALA